MPLEPDDDLLGELLDDDLLDDWFFGLVDPTDDESDLEDDDDGSDD